MGRRDCFSAMKFLRALLLCLVVLTGHVAAQDPLDGALVDCGAEKVAVFEDSVSPDGRYAFGWTIRPARNPKPVDWTTYNPKVPFDWIETYPFDPDDPNAEYRLLNGVLDLRAHRFTPLGSRFPYWPHKNHGEMGVAWSHGSRPGKFAVVNNDARFYTIDLWLIETGDTSIRVVDLIDRTEKSVRRFLRQRMPEQYDSLAVTYGDVSFVRGVALIDFSSEIPKSLEGAGLNGTVRIALPAGTITGVKER